MKFLFQLRNDLTSSILAKKFILTITTVFYFILQSTVCIITILWTAWNFVSSTYFMKWWGSRCCWGIFNWRITLNCVAMILYRQGGYRIRCCTGGTQWFGMMTWAMGNDVLVFFFQKQFCNSLYYLKFKTKNEIDEV